MLHPCRKFREMLREEPLKFSWDYLCHHSEKVRRGKYDLTRKCVECNSAIGKPQRGYV
jgi:hypothetical protein